MKLSVELFQKTVQQLKGESVTERAEKRATPRVGIRARIQLKQLKSGGLGPATDVWTRDISRVGLGIIHTKKLRVGDLYFLTLAHEDEDDREKPLALICTVRGVHELGDGMYSIGFTFEDMRAKQFPARAAAAEPVQERKTVISVSDQDRIRNAILG